MNTFRDRFDLTALATCLALLIAFTVPLEDPRETSDQAMCKPR